MFTGVYFHSLDAKNRVIIPSKLREVVDEEKEGSGFYVTRGLDLCLALHTPLAYQEMASRIEKTPYTRPEARKFQRLLFSSAQKTIPDQQGRILIPKELKEDAQLDRDVAIVGVNTRIEIWDRKRWEQFEKDTRSEYETFAGEILP